MMMTKEIIIEADPNPNLITGCFRLLDRESVCKSSTAGGAIMVLFSGTHMSLSNDYPKFDFLRG